MTSPERVIYVFIYVLEVLPPKNPIEDPVRNPERISYFQALRRKSEFAPCFQPARSETSILYIFL